MSEESKQIRVISTPTGNDDDWFRRRFIANRSSRWEMPTGIVSPAKTKKEDDPSLWDDGEAWLEARREAGMETTKVAVDINSLMLRARQMGQAAGSNFMQQIMGRVNNIAISDADPEIVGEFFGFAMETTHRLVSGEIDKSDLYKLIVQRAVSDDVVVEIKDDIHTIALLFLETLGLVQRVSSEEDFLKPELDTVIRIVNDSKELPAESIVPQVGVSLAFGGDIPKKHCVECETDSFIRGFEDTEGAAVVMLLACGHKLMYIAAGDPEKYKESLKKQD